MAKLYGKSGHNSKSNPLDIQGVIKHRAVKVWKLKPGQQYYKTKAMKQWDSILKDYPVEEGLDKWLHTRLWPMTITEKHSKNRRNCL